MSHDNQATTRNERIAKLEILFRVANERMFAWPENQARALLDEPLTFFCECADTDCREHVQLTASQYREVRADARRFVILAGHESPDTKDLLEAHGGYAVVQKREEVRDLVEPMYLPLSAP